MRFLILGYGRHGKDTLGLLLEQCFGLKSASSSSVAVSFMYPLLKSKYMYKDEKHCFHDRHNHRNEWFDGISQYNEHDSARLCKQLLQCNDVYVGMRSRREFQASRQMFDMVIWVDASQRCPPEDVSSCELLPEDADIVIYNNQDLPSFQQKCKRIFSCVLDKRDAANKRADTLPGRVCDLPGRTRTG